MTATSFTSLGLTKVRADARAPATSLLDVPRRAPGWPLVLMFVGYPLWWALGIVEIVSFIAVGAMLYELSRMKRVRVPSHFGWWLLFLAWVVLSAVTVQIDAPGAIEGSSLTRYLTWGWRLLWYAKATIVMLYIGNMRDRLSMAWVCRVLGWMFVFIVFGGLLGVADAAFQFRSLLEIVLPRSISSIAFVQANIHPVAAESFLTGGTARGRASAPFAYANVWGLNFACFLPFFVVGWCGRDAGWRRRAAPFVLALAAIPVVFSLNRGLWLALVGAGVFLAVRLAYAGRLRLLVGLGLGIVLIGVVVALSPLGTAITNRLNGPAQNSNAGRAGLTTLGLKSVAEASPIIGFGTTRNVQGNFDSIAGGKTPTCPRCVVPPLGTQGQFSLVTFTQGFVGAVFYFGFLVLQFLRHIRYRAGPAVAASCVLLMHFITSPVYSVDNLAVVAIFAAIGLAWRSEPVEHDRAETAYQPETASWHDYRRFTSLYGRSLVALLVLGALGGGAVAITGGRTHVAQVSVAISSDPAYPGPQVQTTIDTVAQSATSGAAQAAMRAAAGKAVDLGALKVTAAPNSRVLTLKYAASSVAVGKRIVEALAQSVLTQREDALVAEQNTEIAILQRESANLGDALFAAKTMLRDLQIAKIAKKKFADLEEKIKSTTTDLATVYEQPLDPGHITGPVVGKSSWDRWEIDLAGGVGVGLALWALLVQLARARTPRLRRLRVTEPIAGLPILADDRIGAINPASVAQIEGLTACVCVGEDAAAAEVASRFDADLRQADTRDPARVVIVAGLADRVHAVAHERRILERMGAEVVGVAVAATTAKRRLTKRRSGSD
jgi:hypothetical protein